MPNQEIQQIPIEKLKASPFNPRKAFREEALAELADSIRAQGVQQPLVVREILTGPGAKFERYFEIVAGERRFRAAARAGLAAVPCIVRGLSDVAAREIQIVENLHRADIAPLEEANGYQDLLKASNGHFGAAVGAQPKLDVKALAGRVGKSERYVYARLELLKLAAPAQKALAAGKITAGHAQELVPLKPAQQGEMLGIIEREAKHGGLSVQDVREEIADRYREKPKSSKAEQKREKEFRAGQAKRRAAEAKQRAKAEEVQKREELVNACAMAALWPASKKRPRPPAWP